MKDIEKTVAFYSDDAEGNRINYVGKYVVVWRKDAAGRWRVAVDISNADG
jgi:ketosteroid isomerase-like protein